VKFSSKVGEVVSLNESKATKKALAANRYGLKKVTDLGERKQTQEQVDPTKLRGSEARGPACSRNNRNRENLS